jgi:hypothetical protein
MPGQLSPFVNKGQCPPRTTWHVQTLRLRGAPSPHTSCALAPDLDGTMVGDDAATGAFKAWWEATGVVRGGVLVYNTGRCTWRELTMRSTCG